MRLVVEVRRHAQHDLLGDHLHARRQVHLALRQRRLRPAGRAAEELVEPLARHRQTLAVVEVAHVQAERAVRLQVEQVLEDQIAVARFAVRRQPHHLVFARVHLEAGVVGEGRIQQAERVRKPQFVGQVDPVAAADPARRGRPFPDAVDGEDRRLFERRREERAGGVRLVMLEKDVAAR